uniref:Uncharacterized protein n=1 Tax=Zea mays TaxID=4577 RepID=B4FRE6_MAIZE|nr:unknown [Zea mays]
MPLRSPGPVLQGPRLLQGGAQLRPQARRPRPAAVAGQRHGDRPDRPLLPERHHPAQVHGCRALQVGVPDGGVQDAARPQPDQALPAHRVQRHRRRVRAEPGVRVRPTHLGEPVGVPGPQRAHVDHGGRGDVAGGVQHHHVAQEAAQVLRLLLLLLQRVGGPLPDVRVRLPLVRADLQHHGAGDAAAAAGAAHAVRPAGQRGARVGGPEAPRRAQTHALRRLLRRQRQLARRHRLHRRMERAPHALQLGRHGHAGLVHGHRHGQGVRRLRTGLLLQRHGRREQHHLRQGRPGPQLPARGEEHERRRLPGAREAAVRLLLHQEEDPRHRHHRRGRLPVQGLLQRRRVRHAIEDSEPGDQCRRPYAAVFACFRFHVIAAVIITFAIFAHHSYSSM